MTQKITRTLSLYFIGAKNFSVAFEKIAMSDDTSSRRAFENLSPFLTVGKNNANNQPSATIDKHDFSKPTDEECKKSITSLRRMYPGVKIGKQSFIITKRDDGTGLFRLVINGFNDTAWGLDDLYIFLTYVAENYSHVFSPVVRVSRSATNDMDLKHGNNPYFGYSNFVKCTLRDGKHGTPRALHNTVEVVNISLLKKNGNEKASDCRRNDSCNCRFCDSQRKVWDYIFSPTEKDGKDILLKRKETCEQSESEQSEQYDEASSDSLYGSLFFDDSHEDCAILFNENDYSEGPNSQGGVDEDENVCLTVEVNED